MLRIEVTEPAELSKTELRALATLFSTLAGDVKSNVVQTVSIEIDGEKLNKAVQDAAKEFKSVIDPLDNPAAGVDAAEIFAGGANPVEVFAGNVPAAPLPTAFAAVNVAAPVPSIAPAPVPSGSTVELDNAGLPWDGRIHASSKAKIANGTWRMKKNTDPALIATVEAELRAVLSAPVPLGNVPPPPPPPPAATVTAPGTFTATPSSAPVVVPPPPPPHAPVAAVIPIPANPAPVSVPNVPPAPTLPVASHSVPVGATVASAAPVMTFPQLVPKVTLALANKTITEARLKQVLDHYGLPSIPSLVQRADLVPLVHDALFPAVA